MQALAQDLKIISASKFLTENPTPERKAIVDYIIHQFDSKRALGVTQEQLDRLWNNQEAKKALRLMRFQIIDQKLYSDSFDVKNYYYIPLKAFFTSLVERYQISDVDFIIYARDEIYPNQISDKSLLDIPAFMMFKDINHAYEKEMLLIPEAFIVRTNYWEALLNKIDQAITENLWDSKISDKYFWRGALAGNKRPYTVERFNDFPRLNAVMLSKLYPDLIDARFVGSRYDRFEQDEFREVLDLLSLKGADRVSEVEHLKYKYLLSIDGNSCTGTRLPWIMYSNSVLVKQESSTMEWFYPALKPYVHYVPVDERLSDIFSKLKWMQSHDKEVQEIVKNARNFIKKELRSEHIEAHAAIILNEYHKLHKDKKIVRKFE